MAAKLKNLEITEISGVDKGANPGALAILVKRDYSARQRRDMAAKGMALPDGSYPIGDATDLHHAVQALALGRDEPKAAIRRHIIRRARMLGLIAQLPEDWNVNKTFVERTIETLNHALRLDRAKGKPVDPNEDDTKDLDIEDEDEDEDAASRTQKRRDETQDLKKRIALMENERDAETFAKRAAEAGLPKTFAGYLQTIHKADPKAALAVEELARRAQAIEKASPLFRELGRADGPDVSTAYGQLMAKGIDIAKRDKVSEAQGFAKACAEHPGLYRLHRAETASGTV
ncbi:MAG: hypothetical protein HQL37_01615 [Alphaproteobacteria bacterium]|nr:hypothetical protein [Alphaproteobacteria bacterium]